MDVRLAGLATHAKACYPMWTYENGTSSWFTADGGFLSHRLQIATTGRIGRDRPGFRRSGRAVRHDHRHAGRLFPAARLQLWRHLLLSLFLLLDLHARGQTG